MRWSAGSSPSLRWGRWPLLLAVVVSTTALAAVHGMMTVSTAPSESVLVAAPHVAAAEADVAQWRSPGLGPFLFAELRRATEATVENAFVRAGAAPPADEAAATAEQRGLFHYGRQGPVFSPALFPRLQVLLSGWEAMRAEAVAITHDSNLVRKHVHFGDASSVELMEDILEQGNVGWVTAGWIKDRDWQSYGLVMHDHVLPGATETLAPTAVALLKQVPGVRLAGFSKMAPHGHIVPHVDNAGLNQRSVAFHVCLTGHGRMRVVDDWIEQLPGHLVVFDSNVLHEVVNGPEERIVLYGELDVDIFLWKTEGLDLRRQMVELE